MNEFTDEAQEIVAQIKTILAGRDRLVQSIVLADLLATWIAGHTPHYRNEILLDHIDLVRDLIPHNEREIFGNAGHPGWRDSKEEMEESNVISFPF
jgi:hypothetical protein